MVNHLGVARTFQNIRLFPALTALENVKVGVETRQKRRPVAAMLGMPWQRREERESTADGATSCCELVGLARGPTTWPARWRTASSAGWRSPGRSAPSPGVILLDEPAAGTNPAEKRELAELIQRINAERGISVLLIEHDMKLVMSVAHRIIVLNFGEKIAEGTPEQIQRDPAVIAAYLGTSRTRSSRREDRPARAAPHRRQDDPLDEPTDPDGATMSDAAAPEPARGRGHRGPLRRDPGAQGHLASTSTRARSSRCSAPTARARPPRRRPSRACCGRPPGEITFEGERIDGIPAHELISLGICHVPEGRRVFPRMTVAGEPRDGRVPVQAAGPGRSSSACSSCSRGCASG